ncbi:hypothetical protein AB0K14_37545 [Actinosynnema sp. NPDC050801]|uniref:hypothetical protein n=1 Tax=unclassified Actinosynnema TaxID=2637065 RepID=UPI0033D48B94
MTQTPDTSAPVAASVTVPLMVPARSSRTVTDVVSPERTVCQAAWSTSPVPPSGPTHWLLCTPSTGLAKSLVRPVKRMPRRSRPAESAQLSGYCGTEPRSSSSTSATHVLGTGWSVTASTNVRSSTASRSIAMEAVVVCSATTSWSTEP